MGREPAGFLTFLILGAVLSNFLPIDSLARRRAPGFELAAPHPLAGRTRFLRLPPEGEWEYQVTPGELRVEQNLLLRDEMWVTKGEARFTAIHSDGRRLELRLRVRPWKPRGRECQRLGGPGRWWGWLGEPPAARHRTLRCCRTEREIRIDWRAGPLAAGESLTKLLDSAGCH